MTPEQLKDKAAYEACYGDGVTYLADSESSWWIRNVRLAPWSSTDAAIAHAERGGFWWTLERNDQPGYIASVFRLPCPLCPSGGTIQWGKSEDSPGIALRNAILARKESQP